MTLIVTKTGVGLLEQELTSSIIGAFYGVYNALGYGFLETVYKNALEIELRERGVGVIRELAFAVTYRGHTVGRYRADIVVESKVLVEVKCGASLSIADHNQVANYLTASRLPIALLFHFGPKPAFYRTVQSRA